MNGWRMLRERWMSFSITDPWTLSSYAERSLVSPFFRRVEDRLGGEHAGVHGQVDALQLWDVDHAGRVAGDAEAGRRELLGHRPVAARRDRLGAPGHALPALEHLAHHRVRLELLEHVVDREGRVAVVEPGHEAHRDLVLAHRVDEASAELAVLGAEAQRPAERVDHAVERLLDLPHLLDPELPLRRVLARHVEVADRGAGQVALGPLGEHRCPSDQVRAGLEVAELLALAVAALVAGANAAHGAVLHQQLGGGGLGKDVDAGLLGLLPEPAPELGDRGHVVAVVAERRRGRLERDRPPLGHEVDGVRRRPGRRSATRTRRRPGTACCIADGSIIAPESRCEPVAFPFSTSATGTSPSDSASPGSCSRSCVSLIAHASPAGPPPTIDDADLDPLVLRVAAAP